MLHLAPEFIPYLVIWTFLSILSSFLLIWVNMPGEFGYWEDCDEDY